MLVGFTNVRAQEASFPYPEIPETMTDDKARIDYMLENFWSGYPFDENTAENRAIGEQGFVDFANLMQYADSGIGCLRRHDFCRQHLP